MKQISIVTAMLLGLGTAGVLAQEHQGNHPGGPHAGDHPTPEELFRHLDKNGDGKISKDEAPERLAKNFDHHDANKDGFITLAEFKAGQAGGPGDPHHPGDQAGSGPNHAELFKRLDKNGDGKLSKDEAPERLAKNFDQIDSNHDGFITLDELKAHHPPAPGGPVAPHRPAAGAAHQG